MSSWGTAHSKAGFSGQLTVVLSWVFLKLPSIPSGVNVQFGRILSPGEQKEARLAKKRTDSSPQEHPQVKEWLTLETSSSPSQGHMNHPPLPVYTGFLFQSNQRGDQNTGNSESLNTVQRDYFSEQIQMKF